MSWVLVEVTMAKLNPNIKKAAQMGGVRVPPKPRVPGVKTPDQIKKQAQARAKSRMKRLVRVLIVAGALFVVGLVVYFVKFYGRMPKDAWNKCIEYAYKDDTAKFRDCFTVDSIDMVESGDGVNDRKWAHLIEGVTPVSGRPKVIRSTSTGAKGIESAEMAVNIDGVERTVYMRKEDGAWKINLNVAINPRKLTLPDDIPAEYIDNFDVSDEPEAWWEEDEANDEKAKKKSGGFWQKILPRRFLK